MSFEGYAQGANGGLYAVGCTLAGEIEFLGDGLLGLVLEVVGDEGDALFIGEFADGSVEVSEEVMVEG